MQAPGVIAGFIGKRIGLYRLVPFIGGADEKRRNEIKPVTGLLFQKDLQLRA